MKIMELEEAYNKTIEIINEKTIASQDLNNLAGHKKLLEILRRGKVVQKQGIGNALDYISMFDKEGYYAIPKEYVKKIETNIVKEEELNILPLSDFMTVPCPNCGSQTPYMQLTSLRDKFWESGGTEIPYYPFVVHCGIVRPVKHDYMEEKKK